MINILVAPTDHYACDLYRCSGPHKKLQEMFPNEFNVIIDYGVNWKLLTYNNPYDIIYLHNGCYSNGLFEYSLKLKQKSKIILDIDDYWELPEGHEAYNRAIEIKYDELCKSLIRISDYVITTTEYFKQVLQQYHSNIIVFPNTMDFYPYGKAPSELIRFGFTGSRSHEHDMEQFKQVTTSLNTTTLSKSQFMLCGFNKVFDKKLDPIWSNYEKIITNDYKLTGNITDFNQVDFVYRRINYKKIDEYLQFYSFIDVLLAPLLPCEFNNCKSELKLLEAGITNTAFIGTNTGPFKVGTSIINADGSINPNGNCILVEPDKDSWVNAIEFVVNHPELINISKRNLTDFVIRNYNINEWTLKRRDFYFNLIYGQHA